MTGSAISLLRLWGSSSLATCTLSAPPRRLPRPARASRRQVRPRPPAPPLRPGALVRNLVISTPRAAKAILRTHDNLFASRMPNALLGGDVDVAFVPYGEYWSRARRLVTTHLLTAAKVHSPFLRRGAV
ncbi:hypothetical protein BRADI_2g44850v3 [Brachypodium distachyon]|uniref:Cytochrome P450 n=1 Tax=Brachypodium distachyon TaxID=15368 RepID=A0A2K2DDX0_BRADI|nr:hypothetical protein BRADI_2g44850v3 [Brachypodium distachyon]